VLSAIARATLSTLRTPFFALATMASLGIGIGACTAAFSVFRAVYLDRPPYPAPDRLVEIWATPSPESRQRIDAITTPRADRWRELEFRTLEGVAARMSTAFVLGGEPPQRVSGEIVSGTFFETLGVPALIGRTLTPTDDDSSAEPAVVLSEALWESFFDRDPEVLGQPLRLSADPYTVVGVVSRDFEPRTLAWVAAGPRLDDGSSGAWFPVARLRDGASLEAARLELQQITAVEVANDSVLFAGMGAVAVPLGEVERTMSATPLWILGALVVAIYLLALTNLSTLFLMRTEERGRAAAVRASLGGSTWQLGRGLLMESLVVAGAGCALAVIVSTWGGGLMRAGLGGDGERAATDLPAFGFAAALALLASVLVGLEPLRHLRRLNLFSLLGRGGFVTTLSPAQRRSRGAFVAVQVAITIVLICTGGALTRGYSRVVDLDLGYETEQLVVALPDYAVPEMSEPEQWDVAAAVSARLRDLPGVESVATSRRVSQSYPPRPEHDAVFDGGATEYHVRFGLYGYSDVSADFFRTLGISIMAGREFGPADGPGSPPVGIVSVTGARAWWPGEDPIGKRLKLGEQGEWITVVGVAEDAAPLHQYGRAFSTGMITRAHRPLPQLYRPAAQGGVVPEGWIASRNGDPGARDEVVLAVRAANDHDRITEALMTEYAALAPSLPMRYVGPLLDWQLTARSLSDLRAYRALVLTLSALGLFVALIGIAAIVTDGATRRARELGVRVALGARSSHVIGAVVTESVLAGSFGVVVGALAILLLDSLSSAYYWEFVLIGVQLTDPRVLTPAIGGVLGTISLAAVACGRKASRIDPAVALRSE
jgi:putative ABC transport system permease protein